MKPLGRTGLTVTEICLGTMTWGVQNTESDAHEQLDVALDAGINFIDTAEGYAIPMSPESYGKTEAYIGSWLKNPGNVTRSYWQVRSPAVAGRSGFETVPGQAEPAFARRWKIA